MSDDRRGRFFTQIASGRLSSECTTGFELDDERDEVVLAGLSVVVGTLASDAWRFLLWRGWCWWCKWPADDKFSVLLCLILRWWLWFDDVKWEDGVLCDTISPAPPETGLECDEVWPVVWLLSELQLLGLLECDLEDRPLIGDSLPVRDLIVLRWWWWWWLFTNIFDLYDVMGCSEFVMSACDVRSPLESFREFPAMLVVVTTPDGVVVSIKSLELWRSNDESGCWNTQLLDGGFVFELLLLLKWLLLVFDEDDGDVSYQELLWWFIGFDLEK